jgi:hypothetical protein
LEPSEQNQRKIREMNLTFPRTLAAVKKGEHSLWEIGDALLAECGPPSGVHDGNFEKVKAASKYLLENGGYEYSLRYLADLREMAFRFKVSDRTVGISFTVFRIARTPEMLQAIITGAPKGTKITPDYVEKVISGQKLEREAAQREADRLAKEQARKEREKAEAKEEAARKKAAKAKTKKERIEAKQEADEARKEAHKASIKEVKAKGAPAKSEVPKKEEVPAMVAKVLVSANASRSVTLAAEAKNAILPHLDSLSAAASAGMVEAALEAANSWREIAELVQKQHGEYEHLTVVGE